MRNSVLVYGIIHQSMNIEMSPVFLMSDMIYTINVHSILFIIKNRSPSQQLKKYVLHICHFYGHVSLLHTQYFVTLFD